MEFTMKLILITALALACGPAAFADNKPEALRLAELVFTTIDADSSGSVSEAELVDFGGLVRASMDTDNDEKITFEEMAGWDFGFDAVAMQMMTESELTTGNKIVFDIWDRNDDGSFDAAEHDAALRANFAFADLNGDQSLDQKEYIGGFIPNIAVRAALKE
jgi:hypothetical protein